MEVRGSKYTAWYIKDEKTLMRPEYQAWNHMKQRCLNENDSRYKNYGARGIKVCDRWINSFNNFYDDMGARPEGLTLERKDVNGNYEPSNCVWADYTQQARNHTIRITNKSGYRGVIREKSNNWHAYIYLNYKKINLGRFTSLNDALKARKQAEQIYWGT